MAWYGGGQRPLLELPCAGAMPMLLYAMLVSGLRGDKQDGIRTSQIVALYRPDPDEKG